MESGIVATVSIPVVCNEPPCGEQATLCARRLAGGWAALRAALGHPPGGSHVRVWRDAATGHPHALHLEALPGCSAGDASAVPPAIPQALPFGTQQRYEHVPHL